MVPYRILDFACYANGISFCVCVITALVSSLLAVPWNKIMSSRWTNLPPLPRPTMMSLRRREITKGTKIKRKKKVGMVT